MSDCFAVRRLAAALPPLRLFTALALPLILAAQTAHPSASPAPRDPKSVMAAVYAQNSARDSTLRATLEVFDTSGRSLAKKFVLYRIGAPGDSKTLLRFTDPPEIRDLALLSINRAGLPDRQFLYTPATDRVRSVAPRDRSERFAGTDFTFEEIAEPVLGDFTYRFLGASDQMEGHATDKIEALPADPARSQYKSIYYWIARDVPVILHEEMYAPDGSLVRTLHASGLKKISGIWGARRVEVRTIPDGTRTVLTINSARFNTGLNPALFSPDTFGTAK